MPFAYYAKLSRADKRIYDRSDAVHEVPLVDRAALRRCAAELEAGLVADDRRAVSRASGALAAALCDQLGASKPVVRVLSKRPKDEHEELHGLYLREEGVPAVIKVWMRTAERKDVVRFRTFTSTLLHEVLHHLDYEWLGLADSFHTEGFYKRVAHLTAAVCGPAEPRRPSAAKAPPPPRQLTLF